MKTRLSAIMRTGFEALSLVTLFVFVLVFAPCVAFAQDLTMLGGELTTSMQGHNAIQVAAPNVIDPALRNLQLEGFAPFHQRRTEKQGLGPSFVNNGCGGCHVQNGRGLVRLNSGPNRLNAMVIKVSLKGQAENGAPIDVPGVGEQLQDRGRGDRIKYDLRLRWKRIRGQYPDGTEYTLRKPRLRFRIKGIRRKNVVSSLRMTPGLVGMGLLEAISEAAVLALSDPYDLNNDGISGVPNYVPDKRSGAFALGRFGFRASHPTLEQQTAAAAFFDMGVTSELFRKFNRKIEMSAVELNKITVYQALAGVPMARSQETFEVVEGRQHFIDIGCNGCHVMEFQSKSDVFEELDGQTIHPFTDLLLHDMGSELADERAEYTASGSEWRTTPLWGLGFIPSVSRVKPRYLHDGRARSIEEAILWHGGEGEDAKNKFMDLSIEQRARLIMFLESL